MSEKQDMKQEDLLLRVGDLVREELPRTGPGDSRWLHRKWRPSPAKIGALATSVVFVTAGAVLLAIGAREERGPRPAEEVAQVQPAQPEEQSLGRVSFVEGSVVLVRAGEERELVVGDEILAGDRLETAPDGAVGLRTEGGSTVLLEAGGRLEVRPSHAGARIHLVQGLVAIRARHGELSVHGENAEVRGTSSLFTLRAEAGKLVSVAVSMGELRVHGAGREPVRVARAEVIDLRTWTTSAGSPDARVLERLARLTGEAVQEPVEEVGEEEVETGHGPSLEDRIEAALEAGDVQAALELVKKGGGRQGPRFLLLAGDAYREAGMWSEAAAAYEDAAAASKGKQAERALLRAAGIHARKLGDPARAAAVVDGYLERFPAGSLLDEALYLGGVAHSKAGSQKKARALLERYVGEFPKGPQAVRVHLMLAKILALKLSDCAAATKHADAVIKKAPGSTMAKEAGKIRAHCSKAE